MKPEWNKQVLPGWTKYLFYAFLILCAIYFLWPWGLSITWHEWLDKMHRSQIKSQATSLQNSPLFKARFKETKIVVQEPFTLHVQSSPTQWRDELGAHFLVESKKKAPSGVHYLSVTEVLESQKNQTYDPQTMGPILQDIIDTIESWPGVAEFAYNTQCRYGLITANTSPQGHLSVILSPSIKPKDGLALIHNSAALRNEVHLALTNRNLMSAKLPLKEPWNQISEVAVYEKDLMAIGLEPDPDDTLNISSEGILCGRPKDTKGDEIQIALNPEQWMWGNIQWTAKSVTLEEKEQAFLDRWLSETLRKGLTADDQRHLSRVSFNAIRKPHWHGSPNGPIDYSTTYITVAYRYRTDIPWIDSLNPTFQLSLEYRVSPREEIFSPESLSLHPIHRVWLVDLRNAKFLLAQQEADTTKVALRLFPGLSERKEKGFICLESSIPSGSMTKTIWLDLETGKVIIKENRPREVSFPQVEKTK